MAFDRKLASRVEDCLKALGIHGYKAKQMFGGIGYFVNGNMACGIHQEKLIVRVGPDAYRAALEQCFTAPFDLTGRPMRGWVYVDSFAIKNKESLLSWVKQGVDFAGRLPKK